MKFMMLISIINITINKLYAQPCHYGRGHVDERHAVPWEVSPPHQCLHHFHRRFGDFRSRPEHVEAASLLEEVEVVGRNHATGHHYELLVIAAYANNASVQREQRCYGPRHWTRNA